MPHGNNMQYCTCEIKSEIYTGSRGKLFIIYLFFRCLQK